MTRRSAIVEKMREFHKAFGHPIGEVVVDEDFSKMTEEDAKQVMLRQTLIMEEFGELMKAGSPAEIAKEAVDLVYVLVGMFVSFGWDFDEAFRRVHASNMSKVGEDGKPIYREDGKILKGPSYKPATMVDLTK